MVPASPSPALFVGIDIAQHSAQVSWLCPGELPTPAWELAQTPEGFTALRQRLAASRVLPAATLVVLAAPGAYWCRLALDLHTAGYGVAVINPVAERMRPAPWTPPPALYHELEQRLQLRQQLLDARQRLRNQLHGLQAGAVVLAPVVARLETLIATFDEQIAELETELEGQLPTSGEWGTNFRLLLSIKGIGRWTALWQLVAMVNFTSCTTVQEAVGYAGLAPAQHTSGTSVRGREYLPRGGHARLRTALYMATLSARTVGPPTSAKQ